MENQVEDKQFEQFKGYLEEYTKEIASKKLEQKLTEDELSKIVDNIFTNVEDFIEDMVKITLAENKILKRNEGAEKIFPHYKVMIKNDGYQTQPNIYCFNTENDAREFTNLYKLRPGETRITLLVLKQYVTELDRIYKPIEIKK
jgi:hypothetical protein